MNNTARVLFIQGDDPGRRAFQRMVHDKGLPWEVTLAGTLAAARALLAQSRFDVIVADEDMPDGETAELFDDVPDIPFVLLTGTFEEQLARRILERGADDCLVQDPEHRHLELLLFRIQKTLHRKAIHEKERRLTRELRESEQRFAAFMDHLPAAAWVKDLQGRYVYANSEAERVFSRSLHELRGKTDAELFPPDTARQFHENDRRVLTDSPVKTTEVMRQADGRDHHSVVSKFAMPGPDGRTAYMGGVAFDVTERKQAEEALRESEEKFRGLVENMPAAVGIVQGTRFVYSNRRMAELLGYSVEEILATPFPQLVHPAQREMMIDRARRRLMGELVPNNYEFIALTKSGAERWFEFWPALITYHGQPAIIGTGLDITGRKQAEEALRQSERFIQSVAQASPHWLYVFDFDSLGLSYANRPILRELGFPPDMQASVTHLEAFQAFMPPEELPHLARLLEEWQALPDGHVRDDEYCLRRADGKLQYFAGREIVFARRADGSVRQILGLMLDITERKRAEEELRQSREDLDRAQAVGQIGSWRLDIRHNVLTWSDEIHRTFGVPKGTPLTYEAFLGTVHPDDRQYVDERWKAGLRGEPYDIEHRIVADGQVKWVREKAYLEFDADGQLLGGFGIAQDITARKLAEEELAAAKVNAEKSKEIAESASKAKDHFLAVLSHELRTPLTPVLATAAMLERDATLSADNREGLEVIRRNAELEARLIDDLLDVTRIARGKLELNRRPVQVCTIMRRAIEVCRPDIDARRLHFGAEIVDGPHTVNADAARMQQVFWNILKNAIKFTPHEGCISARCWREDGSIILEFEDSGIGIEPEALGRIFDAFEQAEPITTRKFGGLGLGLAISKAIVEMHGGTIGAFSKGRGHGATFTVKLPAHVAPGAAQPAPAPTKAPEAPPPAAAGMRILLVEDHGDTARIMARLLTESGHTVQTAGDVATALWQAQAKTFDLLISDLGLPDGNGIDLLNQLRAGGYRFPAIAMTGYGQEEDVARTRAAGFVAHVVKPIDFEQLSRAVTEAAGRAEEGPTSPVIR